MNMNNLMAQAQKMQKDIQNKQNEINAMSFVGESEWVEVTLKGNKTIEKVNIKNKHQMDEEDLECLEDMIKIAYDNVRGEILAKEDELAEKFKNVGGFGF